MEEKEYSGVSMLRLQCSVQSGEVKAARTGAVEAGLLAREAPCDVAPRKRGFQPSATWLNLGWLMGTFLVVVSRTSSSVSILVLPWQQLLKEKMK